MASQGAAFFSPLLPNWGWRKKNTLAYLNLWLYCPQICGVEGECSWHDLRQGEMWSKTLNKIFYFSTVFKKNWSASLNLAVKWRFSDRLDQCSVMWQHYLQTARQVPEQFLLDSKKRNRTSCWTIYLGKTLFAMQDITHFQLKAKLQKWEQKMNPECAFFCSEDVKKINLQWLEASAAVILIFFCMSMNK